MRADFVGALVTTETGMEMLLDVDRPLSVEELFALAAAPGQPAA